MWHLLHDLKTCSSWTEVDFNHILQGKRRSRGEMSESTRTLYSQQISYFLQKEAMNMKLNDWMSMLKTQALDGSVHSKTP